MITYFLQVNLGISILYLGHKYLFKNLTFFQLNRWMLLTMPLIFFVIPFIKWGEVDQLASAIVLPAIQVGSLDAIADTSYSLSTIIEGTYLIGFLISLILLLQRLFQLQSFIKGSNKRLEDGFLISVGTGPYASFSFFNFIYINQQEESSSDDIIRHEKLHAKLGHSIDNLLVECLKCVCWFNPFVYLLHKELRNVHEFEVDHIMAKELDLSYVDSLTKGVMELKELQLSTPYKSNSNLLKRIKMLYKKPTSNRQILKYLSLPVFVFGLMFFIACTEKDNKTESNTNEEVFTSDRIKDLSSMPAFPGGMAELGTYLGNEIVYPEDAKDGGHVGTVYVSFIVDKSGEIRDVKLQRGIHESLNKEALRAVSSMPNWTPGTFNDQNVSVEMVLPVQFALAEDHSEIKKNNFREKNYRMARLVPYQLYAGKDGC